MILNGILFENVTIFHFSHRTSHKSFDIVIEEYHQKLERKKNIVRKMKQVFCCIQNSRQE